MNSMLVYRRWLTAMLVMFVSLATVAPTRSLQAQDDAAGLAPTMRRHASKGSFDDLSALLSTEQSKRNDARLAALIKDVDSYRKHAADHATAPSGPSTTWSIQRRLPSV